MAGWRAATNQSETRAAPAPDAARINAASQSGHLLSCAVPASTSGLGTLLGPPLSAKGILAAKTMSNTTALVRLSASAWTPLGACRPGARVGTASDATESTVSV